MPPKTPKNGWTRAIKVAAFCAAVLTSSVAVSQLGLTPVVSKEMEAHEEVAASARAVISQSLANLALRQDCDECVDECERICADNGIAQEECKCPRCAKVCGW